MPPWPSRLLTSNLHGAPKGGPQTVNPGSRCESRPDPYGIHRQPTNPTARGPDSATSQSTATPTSATKSHSRSRSHPFPLFGSGRKKGAAGNSSKAINVPEASDTSSDSTDGGFSHTAPAEPYASATNRQPVILTGKKVDDKEFTSAHCMVCSSLVKYPRLVKVFRCAACSTVNDLESSPGHDSSVRESFTSQFNPLSKTVETSASGPEAPGAVIAPLSLEKTREILDRCLESYLKARLGLNTIRDVIHERPALARSATAGDSSSVASRSLEIPTLNGGEKKKQSLRKQFSSPALKNYVKNAQKSSLVTIGSGSRNNSLALSPTKESSRRSSLQAQSIELPARPTRDPPPPPTINGRLRKNGSTIAPRISPQKNVRVNPQREPRASMDDDARRQHDESISIFRPLESYVVKHFGQLDCLNRSFRPMSRPKHSARARSESSLETPIRPSNDAPLIPHGEISELDAKTLLIGDIAENGSWWTGGRADKNRPRRAGSNTKPTSAIVTSRSPEINWSELDQWYGMVLSAGRDWKSTLDGVLAQAMSKAKDDASIMPPNDDTMQEIEQEIRSSRIHLQRTLLKVTENLLKRPGRPLCNPDDARFLLILLEQPLLHTRSRNRPSSDSRRRTRTESGPTGSLDVPRPSLSQSPKRTPRSPRGRAEHREMGAHSGITKRILGLMSNLPNEGHRYIVTWLARYREEQFRNLVELVGSFVTYRLGRQRSRPRSGVENPSHGLVPELSGSRLSSSAQLHAALGIVGGSSARSDESPAGHPKYAADWQLKAAAKVMALLFAANNVFQIRKTEPINVSPSVAGASSAVIAAKQHARSHGQLLPTSDFYNSLLDYTSLVEDFEAWVKRTAKFSFCQYPFFIPIGSKIRILEYDTRKAMESIARDAFFERILNNRTAEPFFQLKVRRDCLVDDSLRSVSEAVGSGQDEIKKSLRVHFVGEEGVDAGGLRKEWFLLLVRDVFDPNYGMFIYDDDSHFCYFNPNTFETSDQYFLVGAVLGLAIYNSTILDVALPPFVFKKLLASAPATGAGGAANRPIMNYTLEDLAEFRPALARGLRQLLDFEGDVESTFCRNFVAEVERYGSIQEIPLCPGGEQRPVTNRSRGEFVELYVRYLLDGAVTRQFEPFKRGFFTVCSGNALSLFRAEEIELLVRGSDEPLDVAAVKAVAVYENWRDERTGKPVANPAEEEEVVRWFWEMFEAAGPQDQRKMLGFITGSDRIPAVGARSLVIKIACLGEDCERFPVARTCFNMLQLYRYGSRRKLVEKLWRAVTDSEGFGLK